MDYRYEKKYHGKIKAVIFDMAGTIVDFGSCAPADVFAAVFNKYDINITSQQARAPMGLNKRDHIKAILEMPEISKQWSDIYSNNHTEDDIDSIYQNFIPMQLETLPDHCKPIDGFIDTAEKLRSMDIMIAATTGYNKEMANIVLSELKKHNFVPDFAVCASEVPTGRPAPWMIYRCMEALSIYPPESVIKVGDTIPDIEAGHNAGIWTAAVVIHGNEMGLSEKELNQLSISELEQRKSQVYKRFWQAASHYVIDHISETINIIEAVNRRISEGVKP